MTVFVISIIVLTLLALLFVVPVMFKKHRLDADTFDEENINIAKERLAELKKERESDNISEEEYQASKAELEKTLAADLSISEQVSPATEASASKGLAIIFVVAVPLFAVALYSQIGSFNAIDYQKSQVAAPPLNTQQQAPQMSLEEAVSRLKQRLESEPDNAEGWFMLARTYAATNNFAEAVPAYEKVLEIEGENDAGLLLRYADAVAMTEGGRLAGSAFPIIEKAMALNPEHPQGLWMIGMAYSQQGKHEKALASFYKVLPMLGQDMESIAQMNRMIASEESRLSADTIQSIKDKYQSAAAPVDDQAAEIEIKVTVSLSESLKDKVTPNDTVFIFARAVNGPPMPVAAVRQTVAALPLTVSLSDAMAMMPSLKLSQFEEVTVGAKISKSGTAGPAAGDLFGEQSPVKVVSGQAVQLVIDKVR